MVRGEPVGDFYVHLVHTPTQIDTHLTSSNHLLTHTSNPSVIHFYDGGWGGCRPCAAQMESWAQSIPNVNFYCICVDAKQVATAFHTMFRFRKVINGYIPSRGYMPQGYGQLGCSGFIVVDQDGCFVSRKTKAFLEVEEEAFRYVEGLLARLRPRDTSSLIPTASAAACVVAQKKEQEERKKVLDKVEHVPSVGVDCMDQEHEECTNILNALLKDPSSCNMKKLYNVLQEHFAHEESLMKQHMEGESKEEESSFSALASHKKDHDRILGIAKEELDRVTAGDVLEGQWHKESVDRDVIVQIAGAFHSHASNFDVLYESKVPKDAS